LDFLIHGAKKEARFKFYIYPQNLEPVIIPPAPTFHELELFHTTVPNPTYLFDYIQTNTNLAECVTPISKIKDLKY